MVLSTIDLSTITFRPSLHLKFSDRTALLLPSQNNNSTSNKLRPSNIGYKDPTCILHPTSNYSKVFRSPLFPHSRVFLNSITANFSSNSLVRSRRMKMPERACRLPLFRNRNKDRHFLHKRLTPRVSLILALMRSFNTVSLHRFYPQTGY